MNNAHLPPQITANRFQKCSAALRSSCLFTVFWTVGWWGGVIAKSFVQYFWW